MQEVKVGQIWHDNDFHFDNVRYDVNVLALVRSPDTGIMYVVLQYFDYRDVELMQVETLRDYFTLKETD